MGDSPSSSDDNEEAAKRIAECILRDAAFQAGKRSFDEYSENSGSVSFGKVEINAPPHPKRLAFDDPDKETDDAMDITEELDVAEEIEKATARNTQPALEPEETGVTSNLPDFSKPGPNLKKSPKSEHAVDQCRVVHRVVQKKKNPGGPAAALSAHQTSQQPDDQQSESTASTRRYPERKNRGTKYALGRPKMD